MVSLGARQDFRQLLSSDGALLVLLGMIVRSRTAAREQLALVPLEEGEPAVLRAIKKQGVILGLDLVIEHIFDVANHEESAQ